MVTQESGCAVKSEAYLTCGAVSPPSLCFCGFLKVPALPEPALPSSCQCSVREQKPPLSLGTGWEDHWFRLNLILPLTCMGASKLKMK